MSVKDTARHLKYKLKHSFASVENVLLVIAVAFCVFCTYQSIVALQRNWELADTLARDKTELELLEVEVDTLELENEYYQTPEYQELMARKLLDKQLPGEHMVVMPENSEEAKTKHQTAEQVARAEEKERSNFEQWMLFLFPSA